MPVPFLILPLGLALQEREVYSLKLPDLDSSSIVPWSTLHKTFRYQS